MFSFLPLTAKGLLPFDLRIAQTPPLYFEWDTPLCCTTIDTGLHDAATLNKFQAMELDVHSLTTFSSQTWTPQLTLHDYSKIATTPTFTTAYILKNRIVTAKILSYLNSQFCNDTTRTHSKYS